IAEGRALVAGVVALAGQGYAGEPDLARSSEGQAVDRVGGGVREREGLRLTPRGERDAGAGVERLPGVPVVRGLQGDLPRIGGGPLGRALQDVLGERAARDEFELPRRAVADVRDVPGGRGAAVDGGGQPSRVLAGVAAR